MAPFSAMLRSKRARTPKKSSRPQTPPSPASFCSPSAPPWVQEQQEQIAFVREINNAFRPGHSKQDSSTVRHPYSYYDDAPGAGPSTPPVMRPQGPSFSASQPELHREILFPPLPPIPHDDSASIITPSFSSPFLPLPFHLTPKSSSPTIDVDLAFGQDSLSDMIPSGLLAATTAANSGPTDLPEATSSLPFHSSALASSSSASFAANPSNANSANFHRHLQTLKASPGQSYPAKPLPAIDPHRPSTSPSTPGSRVPRERERSLPPLPPASPPLPESQTTATQLHASNSTRRAHPPAPIRIPNVHLSPLIQVDRSGLASSSGLNSREAGTGVVPPAGDVTISKDVVKSDRQAAPVVPPMDVVRTAPLEDQQPLQDLSIAPQRPPRPTNPHSAPNPPSETISNIVATALHRQRDSDVTMFTTNTTVTSRAHTSSQPMAHYPLYQSQPSDQPSPYPPPTASSMTFEPLSPGGQAAAASALELLAFSPSFLGPPRLSLLYPPNSNGSAFTGSGSVHGSSAGGMRTDSATLPLEFMNMQLRSPISSSPTDQGLDLPRSAFGRGRYDSTASAPSRDGRELLPPLMTRTQSAANSLSSSDRGLFPQGRSPVATSSPLSASSSPLSSSPHSRLTPLSLSPSTTSTSPATHAQLNSSTTSPALSSTASSPGDRTVISQRRRKLSIMDLPRDGLAKVAAEVVRSPIPEGASESAPLTPVVEIRGGEVSPSGAAMISAAIGRSFMCESPVEEGGVMFSRSRSGSEVAAAAAAVLAEEETPGFTVPGRGDESRSKKGSLSSSPFAHSPGSPFHQQQQQPSPVLATHFQGTTAKATSVPSSPSSVQTPASATSTSLSNNVDVGAALQEFSAAERRKRLRSHSLASTVATGKSVASGSGSISVSATSSSRPHTPISPHSLNPITPLPQNNWAAHLNTQFAPSITQPLRSDAHSPTFAFPPPNSTPTNTNDWPTSPSNAGTGTSVIGSMSDRSTPTPTTLSAFPQPPSHLHQPPVAVKRNSFSKPPRPAPAVPISAGSPKASLLSNPPAGPSSFTPSPKAPALPTLLHPGPLLGNNARPTTIHESATALYDPSTSSLPPAAPRVSMLHAGVTRDRSASDASPLFRRDRVSSGRSSTISSRFHFGRSASISDASGPPIPGPESPLAQGSSSPPSAGGLAHSVVGWVQGGMNIKRRRSDRSIKDRVFDKPDGSSLERKLSKDRHGLPPSALKSAPPKMFLNLVAGNSSGGGFVVGGDTPTTGRSGRRDPVSFPQTPRSFSISSGGHGSIDDGHGMTIIMPVQAVSGINAILPPTDGAAGDANINSEMSSVQLQQLRDVQQQLSQANPSLNKGRHISSSTRTGAGTAPPSSASNAPPVPTPVLSSNLVPPVSSSPANSPPRPNPPIPRFDTGPVRWKGLTLDAAKWTFTSKQLQDIVGRAIRQSAEASAVRLLTPETLDQELPDESYRLELLRDDVKARYKFQVRRRRLLMRSLELYIDGSDVDTARRLTDELAEVAQTCDHLCEELFRVTDQLAQIQHLKDAHSASALSMALRKLNTSFIRTKGEVIDHQLQIAMLEAEREEAWATAENVEKELNRLKVKFGVTAEDDIESSSHHLRSPTVPSSFRSPSTRRSSRVSAARLKTGYRTSSGKASLRLSSSRRSARSSVGSFKVGITGGGGTMPLFGGPGSSSNCSHQGSEFSDVPPVPALPSLGSGEHQRERSHSRPVSMVATPASTSASRQMLQAQEQLFAMLGIPWEADIGTAPGSRPESFLQIRPRAYSDPPSSPGLTSTNHYSSRRESMPSSTNDMLEQPQMIAAMLSLPSAYD